MENLVALSLMVAAVAVLAVVMIWLNAVIGPKSTNPIKEQPFETGETPIHIMKSHIPVKFYLVALIFVVFDVELTYLFPWAIVFRELGLAAFVSMSIFLGLLFLTLVYAWKKGVLAWNK
ncbi:MAG TPA: NADH-quinone oxidoreductase subunit A [Acidobacteriota bacterium]|nr:NADH-quinone oxidoreductase subunit A [Acidobacteriota bacterium]